MLEELEKAAREERKGLWADPQPVRRVSGGNAEAPEESNVHKADGYGTAC